MPTATQETIQNAQSFMEIIGDLVNVVDEASQQMPDNVYLEMMNGLGKLNKEQETSIRDLKRQLDYYKNAFETLLKTTQNLKRHRIVQENERRAKMKMRANKKDWSEEKKLTSDDYVQCPKCDRVITKTFFGSRSTFFTSGHQETEVCRKIQIAKRVAKLRKSLTSNWSKLMLIVDNSIVRQHCKDYDFEHNFVAKYKNNGFTTTFFTNKLVYEPTTGIDGVLISNYVDNKNHTISIKTMAQLLELKLSHCPKPQ